MPEAGRICPSCSAEVPGSVVTCPSCGALSLPPGPDLAASIADQLAHHLGGRYRVERELGQGGMAIVYLAHDFKLKRAVAMKVMRPDIASLLGAPRFLREIDIAARLNHPGIVPLYDSGEAGGLLYYVMPFEEGQTLRDRLAAGPLPVAEAVRVGQEVADALAYAHEHDVVHRDIKPENVLFLPHGHVAIADFGIARMVARADAGAGITTTTVRVGSPLYMSPEHFRTGAEVGPRADVYSLGCVVFEMLVGAPPFGGTDYETLMGRHCAAAVPSLRAARPDVPVALDLAVRRALAKLPDDRFPGAAEFGAAIGAPRVEPLAVARATAAWARRHAVALAALLTIAAGGGTAAYLLRHRAANLMSGARLAVAVPRFVAADPTLQPQAQALADALGADLALVADLRVVYGPDLRRFRDATPAELHREFGVTQVIAGTVSRGGPIRVSLRVIDASSRASVAETGDSAADASELTRSLGLFVRRALARHLDSLRLRASFSNDSAWVLVQLSRASMATVQGALVAGAVGSGLDAMRTADSLMLAATALEPGRASRMELARSRTQQAFLVEYLRQVHPDSASVYPDPLTIRMRALATVDTLLRRSPDDAGVLELRGQIESELLRVGGPDSLLAASIRDLEHATRLDGQRAASWSQLAAAYGDSGAYGEQFFAWEQALTADPFRQYRDRYLRGMFDAALHAGQVWRAREAWADARREFPWQERFSDCELKLLAYTATSGADASRAVALADSLSERERNVVAVALWRLFAAEALARAHRPGDAGSQARRALAALPAGAAPGMVVTEQAVLRLLLQDQDGAVLLLRRALARDPASARYVRNDARFAPIRAVLD